MEYGQNYVEINPEYNSFIHSFILSPIHASISPYSDMVVSLHFKAFYFPDDVGFPIQEHNADGFYLMETHYDNPMQRTGVIDNSGIRITLTKQFRKHEAGLLELGVGVNSYQVVPPGEEAFISSGYCSEKCINEVSSISTVNF